MVILSITLGPVGYQIYKAKKQLGRIEYLEQKGTVGCLPNKWIAKLDRRKQDWLSKTLGHWKKGFLTVFECRLNEATDADLRIVAKFPHLQILDLEDTKISDQGIRHLRHLEKLARLNLCGTAITDEGVKHIAGLPQLDILWLDDTEKSNQSVDLIAKNNSIRKLSIENANITDEGLTNLPNLKDLYSLNKSSNLITDEGLLATHIARRSHRSN